MNIYYLSNIISEQRLSKMPGSHRDWDIACKVSDLISQELNACSMYIKVVDIYTRAGKKISTPRKVFGRVFGIGVFMPTLVDTIVLIKMPEHFAYLYMMYDRSFQIFFSDLTTLLM